MALGLSFDVVERLDNKLLTITDTTGIYNLITNPTGWEDVDNIDGINHTLELLITLTISNGNKTVFDPIDLYTLFGPFLNVSDLSFPLTCSMLHENSVAFGTSDSEFPDGLYEVTYCYDRGKITEASHTSTVFLDGRVANSLFELLRTLPIEYLCDDCHNKKILDIIFMNAYLGSIHASAFSARKKSILNQLGVLEKLLTNVSSYTW